MADLMSDFIGRGWSFPPTFDVHTGSVAMLESLDDIVSSLHILLTTSPGERIMQPRYGCNLEELLFESLDTTTKTLVADKVETAILYFEPRIRTEKVVIDDSRAWEGLLLIRVEFVVKRTNSRYNFVFPFYKNEGSTLIELMAAGPTLNDAAL